AAGVLLAKQDRVGRAVREGGGDGLIADADVVRLVDDVHLRRVRAGDVAVVGVAGPVLVRVLAEGQGVGGVATEGEVVPGERDVAPVGRADVAANDGTLHAVTVG